MAMAANAINNLPIAHTGTHEQQEEIDAVSRNRLLIGRNNTRSPEGDITVKGLTLEKQLEKVKEINTEVFRIIMENLGQFIDRPKWHTNTESLEIGDVVVFRHKEGDSAETWLLGRVERRFRKDGEPDQFLIKHKNAAENVFRHTKRIARELCLVHSIHDVDFNCEEHLWEYTTARAYYLDLLNSGSLNSCT